MPIAILIPAALLFAVLIVMAGEAALSAHNERVLRSRGATEPDRDVYPTMRWAYPASFVAMAIEGGLTGPASRDWLLWGLAVFGLAKALKMWAIASLGARWTFRVLVPPGEPLVAIGPYRWIRHPNYIAVIGELVGVALALNARLTGTAAVIGFGLLIWRRIAIENRALGRQ